MSVETVQPMRNSEYNVSSASFWTPSHADSSNWIAHAPFTFWLIDVLRPRLVVELGRRSGAPFLTLCQAIARLDLATRAVAVSPPPATGEEGTASVGSGPPDDPYCGFAMELRATDDDAVRHFDQGSIDLLHIPDLVRHQDVEHVLGAWEPRLSAGAVVVVHPIGDPGRGDDRSLWSTISHGRRSFAFDHAGGLGILCAGPTIPEGLRGLTSAGSSQRDATRLAYRVLGDAVVSRRTEALAAGRRGASAGTTARKAGADANAPRSDEAGDRARRGAETVARLGRLALAARMREVDELRHELTALHARTALVEGVLAGRQERVEHERQASRARAEELLRWGIARKARLDGLLPLIDEQRAGRLRAEARLDTLERSRLVRVALRLRGLRGSGLPQDAPSPPAVDERSRRVAAVRATGLFDETFYLDSNPDIAAGGVDAASHFAETGWWEGRRPNPGFDPGFYLARNRDIAEAGENPLVHYAETGIVEGRQPALLPKSTRWVRPIEDAVHPDDEAAVEAVLDTGLFDEPFYRKQNPDLAGLGIEPILHFVRDGWREGRRPNPFFDPAFYLASNLDVVSTGENPLVHYATRGILEGRAPSREGLSLYRSSEASDANSVAARAVTATGLFDRDYYRVTNPDFPATMDPALHFASHGWREGRRPNPDFDPRAYLALNPDIAALGVNPLVHFAEHGLLEDRPFSRDLPSVSEGGSSLAYDRWVAVHDTLTDGDRRAIRARLERFRDPPLISVVMPVYNPPVAFLREAVASVQRQLYPHWELCVADDASPDPAVRDALRAIAAAEPRVRLVERAENGHISAASNSALALATGAFVALMDHDDVLAEHALFEVAAALDDDPDLDVLYSDEDHIDGHGRRNTPHFKPDFNPDLFLGQNIVNHLGVYRRALVERVGGFRAGFEGSQDYDLALRAVDAAGPDRVRHIPAVLYHWRSGAGEETFSEASLQRCIASARRAIAEHLARTGQAGAVVAHPAVPSWHRVVRPRPEPAPLVSVIVPTKDGAELLGPCAQGVLGRTAYPNVELLVVDHQSTEPSALALLAELGRDPRVRVLPHAGPFNYSAINNAAVRHARGSVLALLNNDVEVIGPDWLDEMVALAVLPGVGAVGAKLLYPDDRVQHGGVVLGPGGVAGHLFHGLHAAEVGYFGRAALTATVSAVTAACLVVRRSVFDAAGGFDEANLPVAFNDVDLCLAIRALGYRNVWTPHAVLYHHESVSRGSDLDGERLIRFQGEVEFMRNKWGEQLDADPAYNPNLGPAADFTPAFPPRRKKPWRAATG